jgi:FkbM family methyltransferase
MNRVSLLHHADGVARGLRRVGLGTVTRAGRSLLARRLTMPLAVDVDGFRISGDVGHRGHLYRVATEGYEQHTRALFREAVGPAMVVIDIGAHLGLYSLIAASRCGNQGVVYAFEPDPRTFPLLVENVRRNGFQDRITPVRSAVSERSGEEVLFLDDSNPAVTALVASHASDAAVRIPCVTVDDFLPADQRADVVKIDVEGAEMKALRGMSRTIARASESLTVFIEVHPGPLEALGSCGEAVLCELEGLGLRAELIDERRGVLRPVGADDLRGSRGVHMRCTRE